MTLALFFIRADSDLDHIAPVMAALLERGNLAVKAVIYDPIKSFRADPRLAFLRTAYGLESRHLFALPGVAPHGVLCTSIAQRALWRLLAMQRLEHCRLTKKLITILSRKLRVYLKSQLNAVRAEQVLDAQGTMDDKVIFVFDHTTNRFAQEVARLARRRGKLTIALPHSISHLRNLPNNLTDDAVAGPMSEMMGLYDHVIVPNDAVKQRLEGRYTPKGRVTVLGSIRFCEEWVAQLRQLLPPYRPSGSSNHTRVLFILSKRGPFVDWQDVDRVISHLAERNDLEVVIKVHTRTDMNGVPVLDETRHISLAPPALPTASLIDWSDIVIFWGSSVIYDALRLRKPILHLAYLFSLNFDFDDCMTGWTVQSFKDFKIRLDRFVRTREMTYAEGEAAACLRTYVDAGLANVPEGYARFIEGLDGQENRETKRPNPAVEADNLKHLQSHQTDRADHVVTSSMFRRR